MLEAYVRRTCHDVRARLRDDDPVVRGGAGAVLSLAGLMTLALAGWIWVLVMLPDAESLEKARFEQATIAYTATWRGPPPWAKTSRPWRT